MTDIDEFDLIDDDIRDVADTTVAKELASGALSIRTVENYCDHMVRCYRLKAAAVEQVLGMTPPR